MKVEVFFDYVCPYCYRGHRNLLKLLPKHPGTEIVWRPCEAHPRPEPAQVHSDLAIQGMYAAQELGGDLWKYQELAYAAHFEQGKNLSDAAVLCELAEGCGADRAAFRKALEDRRYAGRVEENNRLAWETLNLEAVPSYCCGKSLLGSRGGVLVPLEELDRFLGGETSG